MGLLSDVFTNRYDVESSINNAMNKTAMSWGQLDPTQYAPMTASTALQGDMYGRSLGYMLGGQDPLMKKQELIDQLMSKHPDPRTKEDLMAVARDAAGLGLYSIQAEILDIVSEMPDKEKASKAQIDALLGSLRLTQGADPMIDKYLATKVDPKVWEEAGDEAREGYRKEIRVFFDDIISGYGLYLATQGLQPSDINDMMFTNDGQIKNITMFMQYLQSVSANPFAKWLLANNDVLLAAMNVNKPDDKTDPPKKKVIIPDESTYLESSAAASGIDLEAISKKDRIKITNKDRTHLIQELNRVWSSMAQFGGGPLGEESMTAPELREENQDDEIQKWIGGMGVYAVGGDAFKHFSALPVERFEEFLLDPEAYYRKYILKKKHYTVDGVLKKETEEEVVTLWGLE